MPKQPSPAAASLVDNPDAAKLRALLALELELPGGDNAAKQARLRALLALEPPGNDNAYLFVRKNATADFYTCTKYLVPGHVIRSQQALTDFLYRQRVSTTSMACSLLEFDAEGTCHEFALTWDTYPRGIKPTRLFVTLN